MFLNELAYEVNRSRYVGMSYGVLMACLINLTLMRYQHGVRKGFVLVLLSHFMGQFAVMGK